MSENHNLSPILAADTYWVLVTDGGEFLAFGNANKDNPYRLVSNPMFNPDVIHGTHKRDVLFYHGYWNRLVRSSKLGKEFVCQHLVKPLRVRFMAVSGKDVK